MELYTNSLELFRTLSKLNNLMEDCLISEVDVLFA